MMLVVVRYEIFMWSLPSPSCELVYQRPVLVLLILGFTCGRHVEDVIDGDTGPGLAIEMCKEQPHPRYETQKRLDSLLLDILIFVVKVNLTALPHEVSQGLFMANINARMRVVHLE